MVVVVLLPQHFPFLLELITQLHEALCFLYTSLHTHSLCLAHQIIYLLTQECDLLGILILLTLGET